MRYTILLIFVLNSLAFGCIEPPDSPSESAGSQAANSESQSKASRSQPGASGMDGIPEDLSYSIINSETVPGVKRSLDVRLDRKVSKETLRALANELRARDSQTYDRTFIAHYLPGMRLDAGAWATTHFNPDLEVKILGMTVEEEEALSSSRDSTDRATIGSWLEDSPIAKRRITIFREGGQLFIEQTFTDGSGAVEEIVESEHPLGRRFEEVDARFGEHWILRPSGDLQLRDDEGLVSTARSISR